MVWKSLPPGFRFHPTDVELILYYLKRKIMGRKFHYEAIGELNIYRYSPWDLPDKSVLKSKDLEWFFLCPREKKYANGARVKRATENGYWKTTGKERAISCNKKTVGYVKTLIFHLGHAPQGERTNWVMHEYRILDDQLAKDGVQDSYVLCRVYEKKGLGPKNGAQYGAPFSEADWSDDIDEDVAQSCSMPLAADGPLPTLPMQNGEQCLPFGTSLHGSGNESLPIPDDGPLSVVSTSMMTEDEATDDEMTHLLGLFPDEDMLLTDWNELNQGNYVLGPKNGERYGAPSSEADRSDSNVSQNCSIPLAAHGPCPTVCMQNEEQCLPFGTDLFCSRNGMLPIPEECPSSLTVVPTDDEITRLLEFFVDEDMLLSDGNGLNQDDLNGNVMENLLPSSEMLGVYDGIHEFDILTGMKEDRLNFSGFQYVDSSMNSILSNDHSIRRELDHLLSPLDFSEGVTGTHLSSLYRASTSYSHDNTQQLYSGTSVSGINRCNTFSTNDPAVLPYTPKDGNSLNARHMVDHQFYQGTNVSHNLDLPSRQMGKNAGCNMLERGSSGFENSECVAVEVTCGGSSIHIKAEVTHVAGECTYEALSLMMEGSSCSVPFHLSLLHLKSLHLFLAYFKDLSIF